MVKLVTTTDLKSVGETLAGSSPAPATKKCRWEQVGENTRGDTNWCSACGAIAYVEYDINKKEYFIAEIEMPTGGVIGEKCEASNSR